MKIEGVAVILKVGRPNLKVTATRAMFIFFRKFFHRASRLIGANDLICCLDFLLDFLKLGRPNFKMSVTCTIFIVLQKFFNRTTCLIGANNLTSFLDLWQSPVQFSFFLKVLPQVDSAPQGGWVDMLFQFLKLDWPKLKFTGAEMVYGMILASPIRCERASLLSQFWFRIGQSVGHFSTITWSN